MDPLALRDDLRSFLNSKDINLGDVERDTGLTRSWLSKFRRGELHNPTVENLAALHTYREARRAH